jgi:hypothetical protein
MMSIGSSVPIGTMRKRGAQREDEASALLLGHRADGVIRELRLDERRDVRGRDLAGSLGERGGVEDFGDGHNQPRS